MTKVARERTGLFTAAGLALTFMLGMAASLGGKSGRGRGQESAQGDVGLHGVPKIHIV